MRNDERLEQWRKLLTAAKPEGWAWEPPREEPLPPPQEPPAPERLQEAIEALPANEREIVLLRFADGLSPREIADLYDFQPLLALLIEQRAVERLAETLNADEATVRAWLVWWGQKVNEEIAAELQKHTALVPTPDCPSLDRLYQAPLRWDWQKEERNHVRQCAYCKGMVAKLRSRLWHPSFAQLWQYATYGDLSLEEIMDIRYHLEQDQCRRCQFLVDRVLMPIAAIQGVPTRAVLYKHPPQRFTPAILLGAAVPAPVALGVTGFAGEREEQVEVVEGDFRARLQREDRGWVARAEVRGVPVGSRVLFLWVAPDGTEHIRKEVPLRPAFEDWLYAEETLEAPEEELGEGFFVAVVVPPDVTQGAVP